MGTPRIILDESGSLANTKRHDYLPFGEELFAGVGGRSTGQGYSADAVRQKFTQYERDSETGLDYAQARYFSSWQGRFTSADPLMASAKTTDPQSWNRYAYVGNNPMVFSDPSGMNRGPARWFSSIHDTEKAPQSRGNHTVLEEARAEYEERLADTLAAVREADWLNELAKTDPERAAEIAARNPMLSVVQSGSSNVMFTTVQVVDPRVSDADYSQTHEVSGSGAAQAVTMNLERELGRDGKKVPVFSIKVNFMVRNDGEFDSDASTVAAPKGSRWAVVDYSDFQLKDKKQGAITILLRQRDNEGGPVAALIHVEGRFRNRDRFYGDLRIRIITIPRDLPPSQRDKP